MKKGLFIIFLMLSINSYSQIVFEKGYIIHNTGEKKTCLIKNIDWESNPTEIEYKISDAGEVKIATIDNIQGFGVDNYSKFTKVTIDIDRSTENLNQMGTERNPTFRKETLFLKTLVEGEATLYEYADGNLKRYFFSIGNQPVKQLIFKSYLASNFRKAKNESYKQQLLNNLKCSDISKESILRLNYKKWDLINIFTKFNQCVNSDFTIFDKKK